MGLHRLVIVFGVSAAGKTTMAEAFNASHGGQRFSSSELLKKAHLKSGEALRTADAQSLVSNQTVLSAALQQATDVTVKGPVLLDAHSVIDNDKVLVEIPVDVIEALQPDHLIFVLAEPAEIVRRRANDSRPRPSRSEAEIDEHQKRALDVCTRYASTLAVPIAIVQSGDQIAFNAAAKDV